MRTGRRVETNLKSIAFFEWYAKKPALALTAMFASVLVFGIFFAIIGPKLTLVMVVGVAFLFIAANNYMHALSLTVFLQIINPPYLRVPVVPFLPPFPPSLILLVVMSAITVMDMIAQPRDWDNSPWSHHLTWALIGYSLVLLFSLIDDRTTSSNLSLWFQSMFIPFVFFIVLVRGLRTIDEIEFLIKVMLFAALCGSIYSFPEFILKKNFIFTTFSSSTLSNSDITQLSQTNVNSQMNAYRAFSFFSNPILFGAYVGMLYPYSLLRFATSSTRRMRLFFGAVTLILGWGLLSTFSRGPLLAVIMSTLFLAVAVKSIRRIVLLGAIVIAAVILISWPWTGSKISHRVGDIDNIMIRFKLSELLLYTFADHPVKGVGLGNFQNYQMDVVRKYSLGPYTEDLNILRVGDNTYLQLLAETGIIGVSSFFLLLIVFFKTNYRSAMASGRREWTLALFLGASMFVFMLNAMTMTAYTHYDITMIVVILMAMTVVLSRSVKRGKVES